MTTSVLSERFEKLLGEFKRLQTSRKEPAWLQSLRNKAMDRFVELGFPSTRQEEWRFTNVAPMSKINWRATSEDSSEGLLEKDLDFVFSPTRLVFVNGQFAPALSSQPSLPNGVILCSMREAILKHPALLEKHFSQQADFTNHAFTALNAAFFQDGAFLYLPKGVQLKDPVQFAYLSLGKTADSMFHPRNLFIAEENAQAALVEDCFSLGEKAYWNNPVTEIVLGTSAKLTHYKLQRENAAAFHIARLKARQSRDSQIRSIAISLGASISRHDWESRLEGPGSDCIFDGLYFGSSEQLLDHHTTIDHATAHGSSRELYKGILAGKSKAVFNGRIIVQPDAQKTDAIQMNKNLVLSQESEINTKPELQIFADDVKCKHGATVGRLDEKAIFYLRSRGVGLHEARNLLCHAFAGEILNRIEIESLHAWLECFLTLRLGKALEKGMPA